MMYNNCVGDIKPNYNSNFASEQKRKNVKMSIAVIMFCKEGIVLGCDSRMTVLQDSQFYKAGIYDNTDKFLFYKDFGVTCCGTTSVINNGQLIKWQTVVKSAIDSTNSFDLMIIELSRMMKQYNFIETQMFVVNASYQKAIRMEFGIQSYSLNPQYDTLRIQGENMIDLDMFYNKNRFYNWDILKVEKLTKVFLEQNVQIFSSLEDNSFIANSPIGNPIHILSLSYNGEYKIE